MTELTPSSSPDSISSFPRSAHFNRKFYPTWHCIAGRNFSANFSHKTKNFYYFTIDQTTILLWKS